MSGVRSDSILEVIESGLRLPLCDYIDNSGATSTTDVFLFKRGGASGATLVTVTVTYTDDTKSQIVSVARLPRFPA